MLVSKLGVLQSITLKLFIFSFKALILVVERFSHVFENFYWAIVRVIWNAKDKRVILLDFVKVENGLHLMHVYYLIVEVMRKTL